MSVLEEKRLALLAAGGEAAVEKQHAAGKLTARERVLRLLDAGSFVEIGAYAGMPSALIAGYGTVDMRPVYVVAQDYTVCGGAVTPAHAQKAVRALDLACQTGAPVIWMFDSAGADVAEGVKAQAAYAALFAAAVKLSGIVPQIGLLLGPCAGSAAMGAALCDILIAEEKNGSLFITGPQVLSSRTGRNVTVESLGGAEKLAASGAAHIVAEGEDECFAAARKVLALLPSNNAENAPIVDNDDLNRMIDANVPCVRCLIKAVADNGSFVELQGEYAPNMVTGFARIGGRSVGFVANNAAEYDGALCEGACDKAARFIRLCDAFHMPVISLVDTQGFDTVEEDSNAAYIAAGARLVYAYAETTAPKISVIKRATGFGYAAMGSRQAGADLVYAWPEALIAPMPAASAVHLMQQDELHNGASEQELIAEYEKANGAFAAAELGLVDDVIDPAATRQMLCAAVEMLISKHVGTPARKHGNLPL